MKNYSTLFCMLLPFCIFIKVTAKSYDDQNFICADEIGPVLEFFVPKFTPYWARKGVWGSPKGISFPFNYFWILI